MAVASARRGVTDHLLGLVEQVREAIGVDGDPPAAGRAAADRAVASGELVAASLLAVALADLGVPAVVLDAREAGLGSDGQRGRRDAHEAPKRSAAAAPGHAASTPVVTGFQGWHRGRITTLGRGGSDITAVALAAALGAEACELVKEPGRAPHRRSRGSCPRPGHFAARTHRFVSELALAGARVIHHAAATRAERDARATAVHVAARRRRAIDGRRPGRRRHRVGGLRGESLGEPGTVASTRPPRDPADVATVSLVSALPDCGGTSGRGPRRGGARRRYRCSGASTDLTRWPFSFRRRTGGAWRGPFIRR